MDTVPRTADVVVVGAGATGAAAARELTRRGRRVLVLDQGPRWAAGCSFGNAGLVCPSHAGPYASRTDLRHAARWLLRTDSPLGIAPDPRLVPFLGRLLAATRPETARHVLEVSRAMCTRALQLHEQLLAEDIDTGLQHAGLLDTYIHGGALDRARDAAEDHRRRGLRPEVLDSTQVRAAEPALGPSTVGGVLYPDEAHCDPIRFVESVAGAALAAGAQFLGGVQVLGLERRTGGAHLRTTAGDLDAASVVIATGAWGAALAGLPGPSMPLASGKGYTIDLAADGRPLPRRPFMLQEDRIAVTPLGDRLRLAGTMQFTGIELTLAPRRLEGILAAATRRLPSWAGARIVSRWTGLRPCTPHGLPYVGRLDEQGHVVACFGHAMLGLTLAPLSGMQIADLVDGKTPEFADELAPPRRGATGRTGPRRAGRAA